MIDFICLFISVLVSHNIFPPLLVIPMGITTLEWQRITSVLILVYAISLTLLQSERPKLHRGLAGQNFLEVWPF